MITANYFLDIISGAIKDINIGLETQEVLFEIFNSPEIITNDDIKLLKHFKINVIYNGKSYRYANTTKFFDMSETLNPKRCYFWSKSLSSLKKVTIKENTYKYLMSSDIEGIDLLKTSEYCLRLSKMLQRRGCQNKLVEFNRLRTNSKLGKLVIAPIGNNVLLEELTCF